jgi:hypothetical protein
MKTCNFLKQIVLQKSQIIKATRLFPKKAYKRVFQVVDKDRKADYHDDKDDQRVDPF